MQISCIEFSSWAACGSSCGWPGIHVRVEGAGKYSSGGLHFRFESCIKHRSCSPGSKHSQRVALLAKKEVFKIPILSKAIRLAKLVPVDRADKEAAAESVDIGHRLFAGRPFVLRLSRGNTQPRRPLAAIQAWNVCNGNSRRRAGGTGLASGNPAFDAERGLDYSSRGRDGSIRTGSRCSAILFRTARCVAPAGSGFGCRWLAGRSKTTSRELRKHGPFGQLRLRHDYFSASLATVS